MAPICHCYGHIPKVNAVPEFYELKKNSVQFSEEFNEFKSNRISEKSKPNFTAQNHVSIVKSDVNNEEKCKIEVLDEKEKRKSNDVEMKVFKVIKKGEEGTFF